MTKLQHQKAIKKLEEKAFGFLSIGKKIELNERRKPTKTHW